MTSKMALALELLRDGEWHSLEEIREIVEINEYQAKEFASFLGEYDFATRDSHNKVRLTKRFLDLLCDNVAV